MEEVGQKGTISAGWLPRQASGEKKCNPEHAQPKGKRKFMRHSFFFVSIHPAGSNNLLLLHPTPRPPPQTQSLQNIVIVWLLWVLGRSPGGRHGNPFRYTCRENSMDRRAWQTTVHGVPKSQTWLSDFHLHLLCKVNMVQEHLLLPLHQPCNQPFLQGILVPFSRKWYWETIVGHQMCSFLVNVAAQL